MLRIVRSEILMKTILGLLSVTFLLLKFGAVGLAAASEDLIDIRELKALAKKGDSRYEFLYASRLLDDLGDPPNVG
tara:strand:- start:138 stop:365 length:228 start_codon:yes stop_codon:yes gene_type:complete